MGIVRARQHVCLCVCVSVYACVHACMDGALCV